MIDGAVQHDAQGVTLDTSAGPVRASGYWGHSIRWCDRPVTNAHIPPRFERNSGSPASL